MDISRNAGSIPNDNEPEFVENVDEGEALWLSQLSGAGVFGATVAVSAVGLGTG